MAARTAAVTGGTSGIGLAVARTLAEQGLTVFICGRDRARVEDTVRALRADGLPVDGRVCDVRSRSDVRAFMRAVATAGGVDVLVNNAGRSGGGPTAQLSPDLWTDLVDTNLTSVFTVTQEALTTGGMLSRDWGRVINIASTAGKQGVPLGAAYSASKGGVIAFSKALAKELAQHGITVNAVCPGYVDTPMADLVLDAYAELNGSTVETVRRQFEAKIPLGRYSTPEEVAALVGHLVRPEANSITGQAVNVCGGLGSY
ncbi:3-oxoacyl-ACP reductase FabG [Micromonospora cathayae]|uniref:3-oxoacyl-ACP reductase FabG n=1 Tax=Micromonospora cathayae TaxID=3028804 RepID=A0ABY7ZMV8_9ACTN|nr:3-oxoacyl-ACP reductase FabG [Micromonospora sp. HUAS 3]WDZ83577.1 3-oxoacyl-ACP reductase FabG [Micromonospora sp. HUAS 3]